MSEPETIRARLLTYAQELETDWGCEHRSYFGEWCQDCLEAVVRGIPALVLRVQQLEAQHWRCFHCDEVFTDPVEAREHFGADEWKTPACRLSAEDVQRLRELDARNAELRAEDSTLENDARLWHESEADRVRRIGHVQWWQEMDSREGEKLVLTERVQQLEAQLQEQGEALTQAQVTIEKLEAERRVVEAMPPYVQGFQHGERAMREQAKSEAAELKARVQQLEAGLRELPRLWTTPIETPQHREQVVRWREVDALLVPLVVETEIRPAQKGADAHD